MAIYLNALALLQTFYLLNGLCNSSSHINVESPSGTLATVSLPRAVHTLSYYGLTAAAASMGSGRFSSFALSGLVELPPLLVITWILER